MGGGDRSSLVTRQELHQRFELRPAEHVPESLGHDADELLVALRNPRIWFEDAFADQSLRQTGADVGQVGRDRAAFSADLVTAEAAGAANDRHRVGAAVRDLPRPPAPSAP